MKRSSSTHPQSSACPPISADLPSRNASYSWHYDPSKGKGTCKFLGLGTSITLTAYGPEPLVLEASKRARRDCERYELLFSRFIDDSDIGRLNSADGEPIEIDGDTFDLLRESQRYCAESQGCFDISIASATKLWDFHTPSKPSSEDLSEAICHIDWRSLELTETDGCFFARLRDSKSAIDIGGIAKGWIADKLGHLFEEDGATGSVVNLGGNVLVSGSKPNITPWVVGIRDPFETTSSGLVVTLEQGAVVTSGTYERCFEMDGKLYHHILDPKTGLPVETDLLSATVIADTALDAEGYSTTLLALGMERAAAFAATHPKIRGSYLINDEGRILQMEKTSLRSL